MTRNVLGFAAVQERRLEVQEMEKHPEKKVGEPWVRWTRKRFPTKLPNEQDLKIELGAEREADRDLSKPIPQLLCDFHDQAERAIRQAGPDTKLLLNAQKRMVAMMAQVAIENRRMGTWMLLLTILIAIFTVLIFWFEVLRR